MPLYGAKLPELQAVWEGTGAGQPLVNRGFLFYFVTDTN